jgi:hypothetical protein
MLTKELAKKDELKHFAEEHEAIAACMRAVAKIDERQRVRVVRVLDFMLEQPMTRTVSQDTVEHLKRVMDTDGSRTFTAQEADALKLAILILQRQVPDG